MKYIKKKRKPWINSKTASTYVSIKEYWMLSWCQLAVEFCVQMFVGRLGTRYGSAQSLDQLYKYS